MSFITKLNTVVEELKSNPEIFVAHYKVLPPDLEAINEVEETLGYKLDSSIADFYKECGGVQLLWIYKDTEGFETIKTAIDKELEIEPFLDSGIFAGELGLYHTTDITADEIITDGVILIPPIKISFLDKNYNDNSDEYGVDKEALESFNLFKNIDTIKIRRFDMFDVCINTAFILDGNPYPAMLTAYNKYEYSESSIIYFKEYLNLLLESRGSKRRGRDFLLSRNFKHTNISFEDIKNFTSNN